MSGSNKLLTLTVSSSRALAIQILLVSGLAHELCSRLVTITVRPGGISIELDLTEPQAINQERNREVQNNFNQGGNRRGKKTNQLTTSPKFLHRKEMKSSKGKNPQARRGGIFCEACKETLTVTIVFNIHNSCILTYHDIVYILICIYFIFNTFLRLKFFF